MQNYHRAPVANDRGDCFAGADFLGGDYSVADMECFLWMRFHRRIRVDIAEFPNVVRWLDTTGARPAAERALEQP